MDEPTTTAKHPEHLKLKAVKNRSQCIGDFLEWLDSEKHLVLVDRYTEFRYIGSVTELLAEYFEINLKALEAEKREMLEEQRALIGETGDGG